MSDGAAALSKISGIPREKVLSIWEEVKANSRKLRECPRHRFPGGVIPKIGSKLICLECGGSIGLVQIGEYIRGYETAGGDPNDIWPGFYGDRPT